MEFKKLLGMGMFLSAAAFTCTDVGTDGLLAGEYGNSDKLDDWAFFILTVVWIALGGILQSVIVISFLCKRHTCLDPLSNSLRVLLLLSAPFLMGPVVVNVFGAYLVFQNIDDDVIFK